MTSKDIIEIITASSDYLKVELNQENLSAVRFNQRDYVSGDFSEFKRDLAESARQCNLYVLEYKVAPTNLRSFIMEARDPVILFSVNADWKANLIVREGSEIVSLPSKDPFELSQSDIWLQSENKLIVLSITPFKEVFANSLAGTAPLSPTKRLLKLFATEKKDISYIIIYALIIGLLSLALPLGLQTTIELISGGVFFSSVYILIGLVIVGVMATGILQIVQVSIVEQLQRRIFVRAALEFAYRIPRVRLEALTRSYAPELVNRFFDIITIQKGLPKLLLDLSSGAIQVFFGLLLLSLYHPFFVFFGILLIAVMTIMFYFTGPRGLASSINESKYKYRVVQWLEEIARTIKSFKLAGNTDLPIQRTDDVSGNYIQYRKKHFNVLITQFSFFVFLKVAITGGLLVMGTILVVDRQITLGQFVASEVIIILVVNAVEKIILYMDVVYDLLTAVDKVAHVTDLPLEKSGGLDLPREQQSNGYRISLNDLVYKFPDNPNPTLDNISLEISPRERVCICGPGGAGKSTLVDVIAGLFTDYSGGVAINNFSLRDLDIAHLRSKVAKNISPDDIFDGTLYENITIGRPSAKANEIISITQQVGLSQFINSMPEGLNTRMISGGKGLSSSVLHKIILSRCLAKEPALMILNDFFSGLSKADKLELIRCVINPAGKWTLLAVSNDPLVMASCDRVVVLDQGKVVADDSYHALMKQGVISRYFE